MRARLLLLFLLLISALPVRAGLRMAHIFQDHMVLQRDKPLPVWGWADAGAKVKVNFAGQEKTTQADDRGYWKVIFDPAAASSEGLSLIASAGTESLNLQDVLVGEVWLCSGQSNMARTLRNDALNYPRFKDYQQDAEYPAIRFINYSAHASERPLEDFDLVVHKQDRWQVLDKDTAMATMSIPFFFAKELHEKLGVPIGLVEAAVSGTPQTSWMARETLDAVAAQHPLSPSYEKAFARAEENLGKGRETYKNWAGFIAAEAAWKAGPSGKWPGANVNIPDYPTVLYNALIHPLAPMALQGVLWHQGEAGPAVNYRERLQAQVADWRKLFGQDFYFLWGSMTRDTSAPPPQAPEAISVRSNINEEFLLASQDFGTDGRAALVNFFDLGNPATHWARKQEAGLRMAGAALALAYGKPETVFTGPELVEAKIDGATVRAKFRHVGGGLVYQPSVDGISGFLIEEKGEDPELRWADVAIDGDVVVLSHPDVKKPTDAYYGWHPNPHETLFNHEGFPAFPFRAIPHAFPAKGVTGPQLVELVDSPPKTDLNVSHVRRQGYIFNVTQYKSSAKARAWVRIRLPHEWPGATLTSQGQPVDAGQQKTGADGFRYYEFAVEIDGPDIIVADTEKPPDFSGIRRF